MKKMSGLRLLTGLILSIAVVAAGISAMNYFSSMKKKPHRGKAKEMVLRVAVKTAVPETVKTRLTGFGVAEPMTTVRIAAEVGGRIIHAHPDLEKGRTISEREVLFQIDPLDYRTALLDFEAGLAQKQAALARTKKEFTADKKRLATIRRTMELAKDEFNRVRRLLEENSIGNRSAVDQAEQAMNSAIDAHHQLERAISLYPSTIREAEAALLSAKADVDRAKVDLERCTVRAPFTGRVKSLALERGEYASAGTQVVTLADDSQLEILVSLDAREVSSWLEFSDNSVREQQGTPVSGWFPVPEPVTCEIQWIEARQHTWNGTLSRLVEFDQASRTMTLAVRFSPSENSCPDCPPLVEGMFCAVSIPGKSIKGLFRLSRWLVTTDNTIYVAEANRLKTRRVERVYADGDDIFLKGEIQRGDLLITTRLVEPMENASLKILPVQPEAGKSGEVKAKEADK
ncbi:MAG: HlyD family efflux transporter periplasmic adaptor subunit [Desulfobacterales bacterium]|nr:HlyD family efflux transporter periplasmic adaptor subunit [Desulfobacterales bacterium]